MMAAWAAAPPCAPGMLILAALRFRSLGLALRRRAARLPAEEEGGGTKGKLAEPRRPLGEEPLFLTKEDPLSVDATPAPVGGDDEDLLLPLTLAGLPPGFWRRR